METQTTPRMLDLLGEIANIEMGAAATALSTIVRRRVEVTAPRIESLSWSELDPETMVGFVSVRVTHTAGLEGNTYLLIKESDVTTIVDLMMGGDGSGDRPIGREMLLSGIAEAMNQMMGSAATAIAGFLGVKVNISPPDAALVSTPDDTAALRQEGEPLVRVTFRMTIEGLLETVIYQLWSPTFLPRLVEMGSAAAARVVSAASPNTAAPPSGNGPVVTASTPPTPSVPASPAAPVSSAAPAPAPAPARQGAPDAAVPSPMPPARPVEFGALSPRPGRAADRNIEILFGVALQVTVELGRARMRVRDVLALGPGAVIELERLAGEPVDLFVNDRLFARGEVVVIEENFGVRITEILSPEARIQQLAGPAVGGLS